MVHGLGCGGSGVRGSGLEFRVWGKSTPMVKGQPANAAVGGQYGGVASRRALRTRARPPAGSMLGQLGLGIRD
eukprot:1005998-Rhodomonas_salina.2